MGRRSSGGLGAVLGVLLLLGLVIQVVKLLVVPLTILAIGAVVGALTPGGSTAYDLGAFRAAFAVQYVFWAVGLVGLLRHRGELLARLAER